MTISDGVSVIIEEGGILNVRDSAIQSENPPSGLAGYGYWEEPDRSAVLIPGSDFGVLSVQHFLHQKVTRFMVVKRFLRGQTL